LRFRRRGVLFLSSSEECGIELNILLKLRLSVSLVAALHELSLVAFSHALALREYTMNLLESLATLQLLNKSWRTLGKSSVWRDQIG